MPVRRLKYPHPTRLLTALDDIASKTPAQKSKDLQRLAYVTSELARAGAAVIAAPVAPKAASRDAIKSTVLQSAGPGGNFFTIHVATPLEHCEATDRKGVYSAARKGELTGVAGVDETYEAPERADLVVDLTQQSVPEIVTSEYSCRPYCEYRADHVLTGIVLLLETNALV